MNKKMLWLLIQYGIVGLVVILFCIFCCLPVYHNWEGGLSLFTTFILSCIILIVLIFYSQTLEKKYPLNEAEKEMMHQIDSSVLNSVKGILLIITVLIINLDVEIIIKYIPIVLWGIWGLIHLLQFVGYYRQLRKSEGS